MSRRPRRRARLSLPFALLAVAIVGVIFTSAAMSNAQQDAERNTELPEVTAPAATPTPSHSQAAATPTPTPTQTPEATPAPAFQRPLRPVCTARGVPSDMEKAAVVWCVLNRVDAEGWPDTVAEVITQPNQFAGYSPDYPATEELKAIAADVMTRWERERREGGDVGRVLPDEYFFFTGDGEHNHFRTEYSGGTFWDWTLENPYGS